MPTLHKTTEETKIVLRWVGIFIGCFIVFFFLVKIALAIKQYFTPPPPPTVAFGKLSSIVFPKSASLSKDFSYSLNTLTGTLPVFADRATVFKTADFEPNLLNLQRAQEKVSSVGFPNQGVSNNGTVYIWQSSPADTSGLFDFNRKLTLDTSFYNFNLTSDYLDNKSLASTAIVPSSIQSIDAAKNFLIKAAYLPNDLDPTKTSTLPFSVNNGILTKASSLSQGQVVKVSFFQKDIDKLPIVYPNPPSSTMNLLMTWQTSPPQIGEAHFFHESATEVSSTYPIKTADEAFEDLKTGDAYVALSDDMQKSITITNVYLAYYGSAQAQQYLMPVVVFEGKKFSAYVSAIKSDWIK